MKYRLKLKKQITFDDRIELYHWPQVKHSFFSCWEYINATGYTHKDDALDVIEEHRLNLKLKTECDNYVEYEYISK